MTQPCYGPICFVPLNPSGTKLFGFPEFLTGLALMILVWTIADVRYRFRIATAPFPVQPISLVTISFLGFATLLTDLWRAQGWLVPKGNLVTPAEWQALLAGLLLATFLTWVWFALIRPPTLRRSNAERYAHTLYHIILKGSPSELQIVAGELVRSARSLIKHAPDKRERELYQLATKNQVPLSHLAVVANEILLLIADKRFCRAVVESSPATAWALFQEIGDTRRYGVSIGIFARNLISAALANRDSFLFQEAEGYESGLLGYHKPLSQAMFGNYEIVEGVGTSLDPDYRDLRGWTAEQWKAYCRIVLMAFDSYVKAGQPGHSYTLYRSKGHIEDAPSDLYQLDGTTANAWNSEAFQKLQVAASFVRDVIARLDKEPLPSGVKLPTQEHGLDRTWYDHSAEMIVALIWLASNVQSPRDFCWSVQHNAIWHEFFNFGKGEGRAAQIIQFKARRLIYDEINEMSTFPNFKGAKILAFCLNVMGLTVSAENYYVDSRALHKAVLEWVKRHYSWLHSYNPRVAAACLVDGMKYDHESLTITRTSPAEGLRREPHHIRFVVDPPRAGVPHSPAM